MGLSIAGTGTSRGVAIGRAHLVSFDQPEVRQLQLDDHALAEEIARYRTALAQAQRELRAIRERIPTNTPADVAEFVDTHLLMLEDTALTEEPIRMIKEEACNAEWALKVKRDSLTRVFDDMDDPYLRTRKDDIDHVVGRIQRILNAQDNPDVHTLRPQRGQIIVADDIAPADVVVLHEQGIAGLVTEFGSPLSHTSILARSLHLPAVVGVRRARTWLRENEMIIVDGERGVILADCSEGAISHYRRRQHEQRAHYRGLSQLKNVRSRTSDGVEVCLEANVELPSDIRQAEEVGADGIGLFRTEFLFLNRKQPPDEDEQLAAYRQALDTLPDHPVTIRTLDLGADKALDQMRASSGPLAINPALGLRAVRMCLADMQLFKPQLRAILRLSGEKVAEGRLRVMVPMLCNVKEIFQVKHLMQNLRRELRAEGHKVADDVPLGGMIEVPAAAIAANIFAKHLDFMSIGTNDLIQYTLAMDRIDDSVSYLYDPLHPAVLRLLSGIIDAGRRRNVPVSMCGEMASDLRYVRLLLGLGLREFSMHPGSILEVRQAVRHTKLDAVTDKAKRVLRYSNPATIAGLVHELNEEH